MSQTPREFSFSSFERTFKQKQTQLGWEWIPADLETPVSAYLKLCGHKPHSFLFESVEGGAVLGRYSIIGFAPDLIWRCTRSDVEIKRADGSFKPDKEHPIKSLKQTIKACHIGVVPEGLPPMATSGLFGFLGYDMIRQVEAIADKNPDDLQIPDSILLRPTMLAIFDNVKNMICLVTPIYDHAGNSETDAAALFERTSQRLKDARQALLSPLDRGLLEYKTALKAPLPVSSNMDEDQYHGIVAKAAEYIRSGDIFQVVLGQRFSVDFDLPAFALYRSIRRLNPSPFLFHLELDGFALVGSSPEILVRVRDHNVTIRPIAGTRKRGENAAEDSALAEDLLADPKERAEHLMLLDLGRNDVGRVSEFGSVKVTDRFIVEHYSHVMHIVSNVEGRLKPDTDIVDALMAGFPAGTVSGAPKIRAMQIIDELETTRRGYYAGGVGYLSGNGDMDTCIALRTAIVKDGKMHVQAGAGIVADSKPQDEFQETVNKAKALIQAAEEALSQASAQDQKA
jgi:anthranilate synthase component 1